MPRLRSATLSLPLRSSVEYDISTTKTILVLNEMLDNLPDGGIYDKTDMSSYSPALLSLIQVREALCLLHQWGWSLSCPKQCHFDAAVNDPSIWCTFLEDTKWTIGNSIKPTQSSFASLCSTSECVVVLLFFCLQEDREERMISLSLYKFVFHSSSSSATLVLVTWHSGRYCSTRQNVLRFDSWMEWKHYTLV